MSDARDNRIKQLEAQLEAKQLECWEWHRRHDEIDRDTGRQVLGLVTLFGHILRNKLGGQVSIVPSAVRSEAGCYELESIPDMATGEVLYKAIYDESKRVEVIRGADKPTPVDGGDPEPAAGSGEVLLFGPDGHTPAVRH